MGNIWDADFDVTAQLARRLLDEQFPDLRGERVETLSHGWDNEAFLLGGKLVFRFPRRKIAIPLMEREIRILPILAPLLPTPVPISTHIGEPTEDYPCTWAGYELLPGETGCRVEPAGDDAVRLAIQIGQFLKRLHAIPVDLDTRDWAPGDELDRADLAGRLPKLIQRLELVGEASLVPRLREAAKTRPWPHDPVWVHGDLYPSHLLIEGDRLTGVIDWGDVHLGDPAIDLSLAFTFLPSEAQPAFFEAYGELTGDMYNRALFRAVHYGAMFKEYGASEGIERFTRMGERALRSIASL